MAERLAEINAAVIADVESETGSEVVPLLAARSSVVDEAVDEMFGALGAAPVRGGHDPAGWASGRLAADRAKLNESIARPRARLPGTTPGAHT